MIYMDSKVERYIVDLVFATREPKASGLEELSELVAFHRGSRGLIRALVLRARLFREPAWDERTHRMNEAVGGMLSDLTARLPPGEVSARRCALAFSFAFSALRDRVLFPESISLPWTLTDEELAEELAETMLARLGQPARGDTP